ncbi:hypothetical protein [Ferruginibacter sp.]
MCLFDQRCIAANDGCEEEMLFSLTVFRAIRCWSIRRNKGEGRERRLVRNTNKGENARYKMLTKKWNTFIPSSSAG